MKVIVLGAGLVGGPMARDLAADSDFEVTVADINESALDKAGSGLPITTLKEDLSEPETVRALAADYDLVISAVPGFIGFRTFRAVIQAGVDVVDIAFFPEDPFELDNLAKENNVTAIMDCGVAPGMSNILIGSVDHILDRTQNCEIYVGGLPQRREYPYEYKAVFSPADVIEEYTRPARYVQNGEMVTREALSDAEYIDFPQLGTLEAFNSDGLRTLARTIDAPNMKEKTLRYPGHIEKIMVLRETGFFSKDPVEIKGVEIRPLDFTSRLLFPLWEFGEGDRDITVMKIIVEGSKDNGDVRYTYSLFDRYDEENSVHSMARTTGYTATAAARMVARGLFTRKGMSPPEYIGKDRECVEFIIEQLRERGIIYNEEIKILS
ncbi:MAG: saccharopine dehydrogenase [Candidatus Latescibacteria bacterium]|nr:saccharopine dehydrogenase [bacterium]MBD3424158.1 saccharopine dehydrogenase [Candidatus Latescibacterota bacterium]